VHGPFSGSDFASHSQLATSTVPPRRRSIVWQLASVAAGAGNRAVTPDAASESGFARCGALLRYS